MAAKTFTLPTGDKVTSATQRRYVLVLAEPDRSGTSFVRRRSDSLGTIRQAARKERWSGWQTFVADMSNGKVRQLDTTDL